MHPDEAIARLAAGQHAHFSRAQALAIGLSAQQIRYRLETGRWIAVHRSAYRIAGAPSSFEGSVLGAHFAAGEDTAAASVTAGKLWRLVEAEPIRSIELVVANERRVRIPGVVVHRMRVDRRDLTHLGPIPITSPVRTLVDLASALKTPEVEAALDEAIRRRLVSVPVLLRRLRPGTNRIADLRALLEERRGDASTESALERRFVRIIKEGGLPDPIRQFIVQDATTFVARVDFAYVAERIAIEVDGYAYHSARSRFDADRERDHRLRECGWLPLRFTSRHIDDDPENVVRRVRSACRERRSLRAD